MPNNNIFLWGKKFCHENSDNPPHKIHIAGKNSTLCGMAMLGNNYAVQNVDIPTCTTCIEKNETGKAENP